MKTINSTAITEYFRESKLMTPSHYNQSMMYRCNARINIISLNSTIRALCHIHENLRSIWDGTNLIIREPNCTNLFRLDECSLQNSPNEINEMSLRIEEIQSSINLSTGPLVHICLFHMQNFDLLFITIHHLIVDGVSWRIIADDLNCIYPQVLAGSVNIRVPKCTCSYYDYANAIHDYAKSEELFNELPYWIETVSKINSTSYYKSVQSPNMNQYPFCVNKDTTHKILTDCIEKYRVEINDLLITALSRAWFMVMGEKYLSFSMEGHGRESFGEKSISLERTIGWFTTIFPVIIDCSIDNIANHISKITKVLHSIPNKGFGYGILRYIAQHKELDCKPLFTFNYLGSFEERQNDTQIFNVDFSFPKGSDSSSKNQAGTPFSINCALINHCITGTFSYDNRKFDESASKKLIDEFSFQLSALCEENSF